MGTCGACGADNREGARFCDSCGVALGREPTSPAAAQARKVVTILFADLVGSTAAQEGMDPESARGWIEACYRALRGAVEAHQGRVVKFTGDGVMAVFGVPDVREDDAPRALHAAVDLHRAIAGVSPPAGLGDDARLALRVGVNTGEVVVSAGDADVVGDAVNVASRLEQAAAPGEVLVGETTYRLVRMVAQLRALPPLDLKGKADPVPAFRLVSLDPPTDAAAGTPFVGRAGELERLNAVLDLAVEERRPQLVTVVGSPGVGKSRLARELASTASDRARVVEVRCDPDGTSTFAPVAAALRAAAGLDDDAGADTVVAALRALFPTDEPDRERIAQVAAGLLGVGEPGLPEETFWAVRRLIENAARLRPHLFVFEDVHWAEPLLLDLIENVAEWARDVPVLLVATARPEVRELRPALVEVGRRVRAVVVLEGLAVDESRRLTRALLEGTVLPDRLLDRIAAASEGNPLFVRELVRMLVEDGALRPGERRWDPTVAVDDIEVPPSIQAVLAARIDRLAPPEQEVLGAASVVGREFSRGAVAALVDPATRARLDEVLEGLRRKELVESTGTYWLDEPLLRFHHALVLDAAYRRLLKATRAELHERAAAWIEEKAGDLVEQDDAIGLQLERAHLLAVETGRPGEALGQQAATRLAAAGRRALDADDQGGAATFLGRALRCLPSDDPRRAGLLIDRCEALLSMGDATDAGPVVDELQAVAGEDPRARAWAECFVGELANLRDAAQLAETAERVGAAAQALAEQGDPAGEAKAHAVLASSLARLGRIGDSEAALDRALAAARRAGDRRRATAILAGAPTAALWGPNPVTRASGRCLDVVRVLRITSRSPAVEATSLRCQAVLEALRGRAEAARRMLASARRSLEELGHEHGLVEVDLAAGTVELLAGDLAAAQGLLEEAYKGFHGLGVDVDAARAAALLARVQLGRGAAEAALELTMEAERLGGDDLKAGIAWRSVRAEALAQRGDLDQARRLAEAAVALAAPTDALVDHADALVALAAVLRRSGDADGAAARAGEGIALYERKEASVPADRARALFGDPAATPSAVVDRHGQTGTSSRLENRASRFCEGWVPRLLGRDWDGLRELFAEDITGLDHRPMMGMAPLVGKEAVIEGNKGVLAMGVTSLDLRPVAVRGERWVLMQASYGGTAGGVDVLQLIGIDEEDHLQRSEVFEVDQQDEAMARLEELHAGTGATENAAVRAFALGVELSLEQDLETYAENLAPDIAFADRRAVVGGFEDVGRDRMVAVMRAIVDLGTTSVDWRVVATVGDRACVVEAVYGGVGGEVPNLNVVAVDDEGRIAVTEVYDLAQRDEALARAEQLAADGDPQGGARELAERSRPFYAAALAHGLQGDWDGCRALLHPSTSLSDRRRLLGGFELTSVDEVVAFMRSVTTAGVTGVELQPVARRGDLLELVQIHNHGASGSVESLQLHEFDPEGRVRATVVYDVDQLAEAMQELDERYAAALPPAASAAWRVLASSNGALNRHDLGALLALFTDDMVVVDHRRMSLGEVRGSTWVLSVAAALEESADVRWPFVDVLDVCDRGLLGQAVMQGTRGGGSFTAPLLVVSEVRAGRLARMDFFGLDDGAAAWARYAELSGASGGASGNAAVRALERSTSLILEGRLDEAVELYRADLVMHDHRPLVGGVRIEGEEFEDTANAIWRWEFDRVEVSVEDLRGDRVALVRAVFGNAASEVEALLLVEVDDAGRYARLDVFDSGDLAAARAALDDRCIAPGSSTLAADAPADGG